MEVAMNPFFHIVTYIQVRMIIEKI